MNAKLCLAWRGQRLLLLLFTIVAVSLRPTLGSGGEGPPPPKTPASDTRIRPAQPAIEGAYSIEGSAGQVFVKRIFGDLFQVTGSNAWEGVGILDGSIYRGVFRLRDRLDIPGGAMGEQTIDWTDPENPSMRATYTVRREGQVVQRWRHVPDSGGGLAPKPPKPPGDIIDTPPDPGPNGYVYVEELPEAVSKVEPVYPDEARRARIEGVVLVQAHVLENGRVGECRIVKSVPELDEAALACLRQWRFKPALTAGKPVAVWVAVPVKFALDK